MQLEQAAALNRYVDPSIPLTWAFRWQALKAALPLLICTSLFLVEQVAFRLWLNDRSLRSEWPLIAVAALVPTALIMLGFEAQVRITHRSKRKLKLEAKQVSVSPAKFSRFALERIWSWRLEPIAEAPELSKLMLEYSLNKKRKPLREWSMVLRRDQESVFLSEMEQLRRAGSTPAEVVRLTEPLVRRKVKRRLRSAAAVALGFYCLMHGLPLLGGSLFPSGGESAQARRGSQLTAREKAKLRGFLAQHFASPEEFRKFLIVASGTLTMLGTGFYFWGLSAIKKENPLAAAESDAAARDGSFNSDAFRWAAAKHGPIQKRL
jgi:hypothetical protein